jgi:hypothetical protein
MAKYRPDVLADANYECDEDVEGDPTHDEWDNPDNWEDFEG